MPTEQFSGGEPRLPVLIVGAGPTGLAMSLRLAREGIAHRVIDRAAGPGETSRAMTVHARTMEFYRQLGFAHEVEERGYPTGLVRVLKGGKQIARFGIERGGEGISPYPYTMTFPQDEHERLLLERLDALGVTVERDTELVSFEQDGTGVTAVLRRNGREERVAADYLYGADGARSPVRGGLGLAFEGGTYPQRFYVADVEVSGEWTTDTFAAIGSDTLALRFPIRATGMQRLIGFVPERLADRDELTFEDMQADVEALLGIEITGVNWSSVYRSHHRVVERFRVGRCFVGGDAAHVHSPMGGQGMNTGIGDSFNLAWKLAAVLRGEANDALLETYEAERLPFARTLVATTDRAAKPVVGSGISGWLLRSVLLPHAFGFLSRFDAFQRAIFLAVSQTRIAYPNSPLSDGKVGGVRGGDRLPWLPLVDDAQGRADNYEPLRSLRWQVHVYGEPHPKARAELKRMGLETQVFPWSARAKEAGFRRDCAVLVRPDGYVALAAKDQSSLDVAGLAGRFALQFNRHADAPAEAPASHRVAA